MKTLNKPLILFLLLSFLVSLSTFSQSVNPQNLLETGLNMGYLVGHTKNNVKHKKSTIWAGDASGLWLSSWSVNTVNPITPDVLNPKTTYEKMMIEMQGMKICDNEYFNMRLNVFQLGYYLGKSIVETEYECSSCLVSEMQIATVHLRAISKLLNNTILESLSSELNTHINQIDVNLQGNIASQQNLGERPFLESIISKIKNILPDQLLGCLDNNKEKTNEKKSKKEKRTRMHIYFGTSGASVNGSNGTTSEAGNGFYGGFDMLYGRRIFLLLGVDFFRNTAGSEFFIKYDFQEGENGSYIQGFAMHGGLGAYIIKTNKVKLAGFTNIRLINGGSIDGNLSSIGNVSMNDRTLDLNIGGLFSYGVLTLHSSFEFGLSPGFDLDGESMKYKIFNIGLGIAF